MQDERSQAPAVGGAASADTFGSQPPGTTPDRLPWAVHHRVGPPASLFGADPPDGPSVVVVVPDATAVVLGSAQGDAALDRAGVAAAGVAVVRRRSGGGAVWLSPDGMAWVDVVVPRLDPRWHDDVGRACWWVGEAWAAALSSFGVDGAEVHRGAMVHSRWSRAVCFAGLGAGEVTVAGRKVVGISQRRTRDYALFQCGALLRWDPVPLLGVLALDGAERSHAASELRDACVGMAELAPGATARAVAAAFTAAVLGT